MHHQRIKFAILSFCSAFVLIIAGCGSSAATNKKSIDNKENPKQENRIKKNPCSRLLENPNFDNSTQGWRVDGNVTVVDGSLSIKNATVSQLSKEITGFIDTYQFEGDYKISGEVNLTVRMVFLDQDKNTILTRESLFKTAPSTKHFILNATSTENTKYIKAILETSNGSGSVILDNLQIKNSTCYEYQIASSLPPKGLQPEDIPQFVVLGFDDNTKSEGINWILDLLSTKKNKNGSDVKTSFYLNTIGLREDMGDDPQDLQLAMKRIISEAHEIGNHTDNHNPHLAGESYEAFEKRIDRLSYNQWKERIDAATNDIVNYLGIDKSKIKGFRTPYLMYNQNTFKVINDENFLYDCSIEDGYAPEMDGTNFRWPYQLNGGSAGHNESWRGKEENSDFIELQPQAGLWELPSYPLMIPDDSVCANYGIQEGLWDRLVKRIDYLKDIDHKLTGLDYNMWSEGALNKAEVLGILKYNLDLRLKGNRAPFMLGTHSQYYTQTWADIENNAPNANFIQMREAIAEFIDYALSKDEVIMTTGEDIIKWCQDPKAMK